MASKLPYYLLLACLILLNASIFLTAYLASVGDPASKDLYAAFSPTCHQLTTRSICLYKYDLDGSYGIGDCLPMSTFSYSRANEVYYPEKAAYKFPVCSRDVAIYLAMLIGMLLLPFIQRMESEDWPNRFILLVSAVPIGIDGTGQLLGFWESTNAIRILTGALIGIVLPFYIVPILNSLYLFIQAKLSGKEHAQPPSLSGKRKKAKKKAPGKRRKKSR